MAKPFSPASSSCYGPNGWERNWKIIQYTGAGVNFVNEGVIDTGVVGRNGQPIPGYWPSKEAAQLAADRVNKGDETGILFASYCDD